MNTVTFSKRSGCETPNWPKSCSYLTWTIFRAALIWHRGRHLRTIWQLFLDLSDFEQSPICAGKTRYFYRYAPNGAAWRRLSLATLNTVFGSPFLGSNQVRALCCAWNASSDRRFHWVFWKFGSGTGTWTPDTRIMMKCIIIKTFKHIHLKHRYHDVLINALNSNAQSAETLCSTLTICLKICMASSISCCDK